MVLRVILLMRFFQNLQLRKCLRSTASPLCSKNVSGKSHSAENLEDGDSLGFLKSILLRTFKNIKGGTFGL